VKRPPADLDLRPYFGGEERGHRAKDMIVLHETVSHNRPGLGDIRSVASFLDDTGLEIHGIIDQEANVGWCYDRRAVFDHAASGRGQVNTRSIGIELVSEIPLLSTRARRRAAWESPARKPQLNELARWCAWLSTVENIPLRYSNGAHPGITTHWHVSETWLGGDGHWDCWPIHLGGHFPTLYVVNKAQQLLAQSTA
jgi:hypothetical protein